MQVLGGQRGQARAVAEKDKWGRDMRIWSLGILAALAACASAPPPASGPTLTPAEAIAAAAPGEWRPIPPEDLLLFTLGDGRVVTVQLAPAFAPVHVENIRRLARGGWWAGAAVYRVQDNYVAQWGRNESERPFPAGVVAKPPAEYQRPVAGLRVTPLGSPDPYAPRAGFAEGWPVGIERDGTAALAHCYGAVGVGRDVAPDTGTGGELYAVIGHAPRHLDRNIALVGRLIDGIDALSARPRGTEALGFYKERSSDVPIRSAALVADLPAASRPRWEVLDTASPSFIRYLWTRANRRDSFFIRPAGGVDLCNAPVPVRKAPSSG